MAKQHEKEPKVGGQTTEANFHEPILWTRRQVANALQVCPHSIARYTRRGELPCVKINPRVVRYKPQDVQRLIESGTVK